jgi:hypothetical protein
MATTQYLIDTNAGIDYLGEALPISGMVFMDEIIDNGYDLSVISRIELYSYCKLPMKEIKAFLIFSPHTLLY